MCGSGIGIYMAPTAALEAEVGSSAQLTAHYPSDPSASAPVSATKISGYALPAVYESGTEEEVRRMKAELKNSEIGWVCNEGQPLPLLETPLKPKTDLLNVLSIHNHEK